MVKKLAFAAVLAAASTSAQAAVEIRFTGTSYTDGSAFTGTLTVDTKALPQNTADAPDTNYYSPNQLMTLTVNGAGALPTLFGTTTDANIYSNELAGEFSQQNDGGGAAYSFFYLYNSANAGATPSTVIDGVRLPDFRGLPELSLNFESSDGATIRSLTGAVTIIGYQVTGAVPEPASWALMIAGFGMIGATLRRRRTTIAFG